MNEILKIIARKKENYGNQSRMLLTDRGAMIDTMIVRMHLSFGRGKEISFEITSIHYKGVCLVWRSVGKALRIQDLV